MNNAEESKNHNDSLKHIKNKATFFKEIIEILGNASNLSYKLSAGIGAVITLVYLFSIEYFPASLTPGEIVLFIFVALSFGFFYFFLLLFGVMSAIFPSKLIETLMRKIFKPRKKQIKSTWHEREISALIYKKSLFHKAITGWRKFKRAMTRSVISQKKIVPDGMNDFMSTVGSCLVFSLMSLLGMASESEALHKLLLGFLLAGFWVLVIVSVNQTNTTGKKPPIWLTSLLLIVVPFSIVLAIGRPMPLLHGVFRGLGVRSENISIEIPVAERAIFERASEVLGEPIVDCSNDTMEKSIIHNVNILWGGIGEKTLIELKENATNLNGKQKKMRISLDTKSIKPIKSNVPLNRCYEIKGGAFEPGKYILSESSKLEIKKIANEISRSAPRYEIEIVGYSDPISLSNHLTTSTPDNQRLSELRAKIAGDFLSKNLSTPANAIKISGQERWEREIDCSKINSPANYEQEACNSPNRKVGIFVRYK